MNTVQLATHQPAKAPTATGTSSWRDSIGIVASIGCAIHCAAMPFVIAYLPALGLSFLADESFHKWMALVCFLIAIAAFVPGIRKHGNWIPVSIATVGITLITFAAFGLAGECCSACSSTSVADPSGSIAIATECSQCDHCQAITPANGQVAATEIVAPESDMDLLSVLAPWITPLGGLVLVSAHLLNRRYGCLCGCCGSNS